MFCQQTLLRGARLFPSALACVGGTSRLTFAELGAQVAGLSAGLQARGLGRGDKLAVLLPNSPEFLALTYACAWLGVLLVPLNSRLSVAELDRILADCQPQGLITHPSMPVPTHPLSWRLVLGEQPLPQAQRPPSLPIYDPEAILGLFYTSGTTGVAKGVMLTHGNHVVNALQISPQCLMNSQDVFLHAAPLFHMAAFQFIPLSASLGVCQVTLPRFDPEAFCAMVERERVTHTLLVPTMVNFLTLYERLPAYDLSSLRVLIYGGSPMAPEIVARCREKLPGCQLVQGYGMTETGPGLTMLADAEHVGERLRSCGRPLCGVELEVVDDAGQTLPRGERGCIRVRGLNVMKGYWNRPEETATALRDGWMYTGDIGYEDSEGYFYLVDRQKDMIITGGENVFPAEVEAVLYAHKAVREAAVIGIPDGNWGERVLACVCLHAGVTVSEQELQEHCRAQLASYKVPKQVVFFTADLPKAGPGKIQRRLLREQIAAAAGSGDRSGS